MLSTSTILLSFEALLLCSLVLVIHSVRNNYSLAPFYALLGGISVLMWWSLEHQVMINFNQWELHFASILFSILLIGIFILYVLDSPFAARMGVFSILLISLIFWLITISADLPFLMQTTIFESGWIYSILIILNIIDFILMAIAWEALSHYFPQIFIIIRIFLVLFSIMVFDNTIFITTAFNIFPHYRNLLESSIFESLIIASCISPILVLYLNNQKKKYHLTNFQHYPIWSILKRNSKMSKQLLLAHEKIKYYEEVEHTLKMSEARYHQMFETNQAIKLVINPKSGKIIEANQSAIKFYGYPKEKLLTLKITDINMLSPTQVAKEMLKAEHEERLHFNFRHRLASGEIRDVEVYSGPLETPDGMLLYSIVHDVTNRTMVEKVLYQKNAYLNSILRASQELAIIATDLTFKINYYNSAAEQLFNSSVKSILKQSFIETHCHLFNAANLFLQAYPAIEQNNEYKTITSWQENYSTRHIEWRIAGIRDDESILIGYLLIAHDISERKHLEQDLKLAATAFETFEAIVITDNQNRILRVNRAFSEITGYNLEEVRGKTPKVLRSNWHDVNFYRDMWKSLKDKGHWQGEIYNKRKNGEVYPEWLTITVVKNNQQEVTHHVATFLDLTERKKQEAKIHYLAYHDSLTSLPNRAAILEQLKRELNRTLQNSYFGALLFLDLDRFKNINDSLGHAAGDHLLIEVAQRLRKVIHEENMVGRLSGDEFVIILSDLAEDKYAATTHAQLIAERLRVDISQPYLIDEHEFYISVSIGITLFPDKDSHEGDLLRQADTAMYQAKLQKRSGIQIYLPAMQTAALERLALENDLHQALKKNELLLYFQPQMDLNSRELIGAEALVRWLHPKRGMLNPAYFIQVAEDSGLIFQLGQWVLQMACWQNREWQKQGLEIVPIAINLSAAQFRQPNLPDTILQCLHKNQLDANYLGLEVTESLLMEDVDSILLTLQSLKKMGIQLAIDDFGTGYSSLSYLKRFPVDKIKIDQSFVRDILVDPDDAAITSTIITMAKSLNLKTIAEGVESQEQYNFLKSRECDEIQGYYYSRPLPAQTFVTMLKPNA
jgi:diguanylate cyclase (GGDEF)-like protein/PAS domain S-box-containing protein